MRILDSETGKALTDIVLYLTHTEALQMKAALDQLIENVAEHHVHFNDDSYQREVTLAIYTSDNLMEFDERSRKLIKNDGD